MKILNFCVNLVLVLGLLVCFLSVALLRLANSQLLSLVLIGFICYLGLYINHKLSTLK